MNCIWFSLPLPPPLSLSGGGAGGRIYDASLAQEDGDQGAKVGGSQSNRRGGVQARAAEEGMQTVQGCPQGLFHRRAQPQSPVCAGILRSFVLSFASPRLAHIFRLPYSPHLLCLWVSCLVVGRMCMASMSVRTWQVCPGLVWGVLLSVRT